MKTNPAMNQLPPQPHDRLRRVIQTSVLAVTSLSFWAQGIAGGAQAPGNETDDAYVVFLGLNVSVSEQGKLLPVVGGSEREVQMSKNDEIVTMARRDVTLNTAMEPKVGRPGVTVERLTGQPVHSPATDPMADMQSQMIAMQNIDADRMEAAEQDMLRANDTARMARFAAGSTPAESLDRGRMDAMADAAAANASAMAGQMTNVLTNPQFGDFLPGDKADGRAFDGFEVTFRISAPEPRDDAYGVLRLVLQDVAQPTAARQQLLKMFRLRTLDATPRKVIVRSLGLPPGATVESFEVYVYADGEELATNLSRNRIEVTADEAHQFVILRHMQRHKGETLPAQIPGDLQAKAPASVAAHAAALLTLGITAEGKVSDVKVVSIASESLPAELESAVRGARFLPALVNGQPVDSTGSFAVSELFP